MGLFSRSRSPLTVSYQAKADFDGVDQTLTVQNRSEISVLPTMQFVALDHYGRELPHVTVGCVLGMDRGRVVVPAGQDGTDVLHFRGQGCRQVRQVRVAQADIVETEHPPVTAPVETLMIDLEQRRTYDPADFWGIGISNPNAVAVEIRLVLVAWEDAPPRDAPRQVVDSARMSELVRVEAESSDVVWLPDEVRGRFHGVLHHAEPTSLV